MNDIIVSAITATSPQYQQVFDLRDEILRKPLGLSLKNDDLRRDYVDTIFIAGHKDKVIGCVLMHHLNIDEAQLRAMAVYEEWQGKGVGRLLVKALEAYTWQQEYSKIILHARKVAIGFYTALGYTVTGKEFTEVGIPHFMMEKERSA
jgi:predicted GNAT family N-acyltransferase